MTQIQFNNNKAVLMYEREHNRSRCSLQGKHVMPDDTIKEGNGVNLAAILGTIPVDFIDENSPGHKHLKMMNQAGSNEWVQEHTAMAMKEKAPSRSPAANVHTKVAKPLGISRNFTLVAAKSARTALRKHFGLACSL